MSKYLTFAYAGLVDSERTEIWNVYSKDGLLRYGEIKSSGILGQYCFFPDKDCMLNRDYLHDIQKFLTKLMVVGKQNKERKDKLVLTIPKN